MYYVTDREQVAVRMSKSIMSLLLTERMCGIEGGEFDGRDQNICLGTAWDAVSAFLLGGLEGGSGGRGEDQKESQV